MAAVAPGGTAGRVKAALAVLLADEDAGEVARADACSELRQLSANSAGKVALMQAGAVEPLTAMLRDAGDAAKSRRETYLGGGLGAAATCLAGLSTLHAGKHLTGTALELVPSLCTVMDVGAQEAKAEAAAALAQLVGVNVNTAKAVKEFHGHTFCGAMLRSGVMVAKENAVVLLRALVVHDVGLKLVAADPALVQDCVEMLETGSMRCQESVAFILQAATTTEEGRTHIARSGAPDVLQRLMQYSTSAQVKDACQAALHALWSTSYEQDTAKLAAEAEAAAAAAAATTTKAADAAPPPAVAQVEVKPTLAPLPAPVSSDHLTPTTRSGAAVAAALGDLNLAAPPPKVLGATAGGGGGGLVDACAPLSMDAPDASLDGSSNRLGAAGAAGDGDTPPATLSGLGLNGLDGLNGLGGGLSGTGGLGNFGYQSGASAAVDSMDALDGSFGAAKLSMLEMQGEPLEEAKWRAEVIHQNPAVAAHVPPSAAALPGAAQDHLMAQRSALMDDSNSFAYNHTQLEDIAKGAQAIPQAEFEWGNEFGSAAASGAIADLEDVIPLVQMLQTGDEVQRVNALGALAGLAMDHQQALLEAGAVEPVMKALDRAGKIAGVQGLEADGLGVVDAANIINSLWRWGRPQERQHLERQSLQVLDGLVQLLYSGTAKGKEAAAAALGTLSAMSDAIKLAFAEAGAVKPLVKLLRTGSATGREEAEGVLWTLLAMNKEANQGVKLSVEACADMVLLLGTTETLAKEAAGVLRNLVQHNRSTLIQAGVVEGLMQVLLGAGAKCTGDGLGISEAATALEVLARGDTRISAIALEAIPGVVALLTRGTQQGREQATGALWALSAVNDRCKVAMVEEGAVNLLVDMLGKGANRQVDETTAGVLYSLLAVNARSRKFWSRYSDGRTDQEVSLTLAAAKGLVPLLHTGSELMREAAAGVVNLCATTDRNRVNIMRARAVEPLVELLHTGTEGAREQAGAALKALVDVLDPSGQGPSFQGVAHIAEAMDQLVTCQMDYLTADKSVAALVEQVVYDAFDRHVAHHTYLFEAIEQEWNLQGSRLVPELRSLRERGLTNWRGGQPLVELLQFGNDDVKTRAAIGLATLGPATHMELIEAGCLRQLVDLTGSVLAEALIALVLKCTEVAEPDGMSAYMQALAFLGTKDTRVARMAEDVVGPLLPVLETGTPKAKEEAATGLRMLLGLGEPMKVLVAKMGMFGPLVELLGTGTPKAREMAAWDLDALTGLMADCNVEVNISTTAAMDLIKMVEDGTEAAAEGAVGVLYNIANTDSNKAVLLHNRHCESIVDLLIRGSEPARARAGKLLRRLTVYGDDADRFLQAEELQARETAINQQAEAAAAASMGGGMMGGFFSAISKTLATPTPAPTIAGFEPVMQGGMGGMGAMGGMGSMGALGALPGGPQQQAERLIQVLLARDRHAQPSAEQGNDHIAGLLHRLVYDIFESSSAYKLNKPLTAPPTDDTNGGLLEYQPTPAPGMADGGQQQLEAPIFPTDGDVDAAVATEVAQHLGGQAVHAQQPSNALVPSSAMSGGPDVRAGGKKKPIAPPRTKPGTDVRPLVQLLHAGTDETKLLALEAVQSLNVTTQVAIIEAGALRPLVELLGVASARALVAFLASAGSDLDGEYVADCARALCALASRDVGAAQAALQCVDGLVQLLLAGSDKGREEAAAALWSLSITNSRLKMAVAHAGAIPPMITLLGAGTAAGREEAAGVLWTLLSHEDERQSSVDIKIDVANALDLVQLLTVGTDMGKEAAAGVIRLTSLLDLNKGPLCQAMVVEPLVELLYASHEGVRSQCAGALRNLAVFQPNVYKDARPELSKAAGEVKRLVATQLDPATSTQYGAAILTQLVYDTFDVALKVKAPALLGRADAAAPPSSSYAVDAEANAVAADTDEVRLPGVSVETSATAAAADQEARETLEDAQATEPARRSAMQRMEANRRVAVIVELLRIAPVDQKRFLSSALACLGIATKMALLKGGGLYPYVELMGADAGRPLAQLLVNAARTQDAAEVGTIAGALSSLAATDNSLVPLCARTIPGLVHMVEHGEVEAREEAAHALKFFTVVSFNMKVQIAEAGAFGPLVKVLGEGTPRAKEGAAGALWRLVSMMNESNIEVNISTKKAADLVVLLHTSTPEGKEAAAGVLRLVAYNDGNKLAIMRARAVEPLVDLLDAGSAEIKEQAMGALNAIAADKDGRKRIVRAAEQVDRLCALQSNPVTASPQLGALLEYLMYDVYDMRREAAASSGGDAAVSTGAERDTHDELTLQLTPVGALVEGGKAGETDKSGQFELNKLKMRGRVLGGSKEANRGLLPLVQLLQTGTEKLKRMAAPAMAVLSTATKVALMEAGATRPLVQLLGAASAKAIIVMLGRAVRMADGAGLGGGTSVAELANELVECFMGLGEGDARIAAMAAGCGDVIPSLIQLLETGNLAGQEQAAEALRRLSVIDKGLNVTIAREGAFEPLVKLLGTGTASAREQAAGALWRQLEMMRENAIEVNISVPRVQNLVEMLKQGSEQGKEAAAAVLRFCANSERNRASIMRGKAVEPLVDLLQTSPPKVRTQVGLALRALVAPEEPGVDGSMAPLGPHATWMTRASAEAANLVELLESGELQEGTSAKFTIPGPLATPPAPPQPAIFEGDGDGGHGHDSAVVVVNADEAVRLEVAAQLAESKVLEVTGVKSYTVSASSQQVAALLEQMCYDLFCLRLAPLAEEAFGTGETPVVGLVRNAADVYVQVVDNTQQASVFRMLLQLLHSADEHTKRLARDGVQWLSINTQVALVEGGALNAMVDLLGPGAAPCLVQLLADAARSQEGVGVVDASRALRALAADSSAVANMAQGGIRGLVGLMEKGVFGGKEEAVRALWSLSVVSTELKYAIAQGGALQPLVEMLYTGKEGFREEVVGLLWSLAMHEGNVEAIIDVGAAAGLVKLLHTGSEVAQEAAAGVLRLCAVADNNKSSIVWAKAVEPLTDCLNLWNEGIREQAAAALRNLVTWDTSATDTLEAAAEVEKLVELRLVQARLERMVQLPPNSGKQNLSALLERLILDTFDEVSTRRQGGGRSGANAAVVAANVALIYGGDGAQPYDGTSKLPDRGATAAADGMADVTEGLGGSVGAEGSGKDKDRTLPFIVQLCQDCSEEVKAQAAGALKCLALRTKIALVEAGALRPMVEMIGVHALEALLHLIAGQDPAGDGGDVAEWAAGVARLALSAPDDAVRADAAIRPIVQLLELGSSRGRQEAAAALHALCAVGDSMKFGIAREGAFEPLVKLLGTGTAKAKEEALGTLWQLVAMMAESNVDVNISPGPATDIAALLSSGVERTATAAAGVLKLCSVAEGNQVVVFKTNAVHLLVEALVHGATPVREQAAGALINLAITDRGWCQEGWLVASASEVEALTRMLQLDAIGSTPGVVDPKGAVRQMMALLEQLLLDIAEFRQLYYASQRGQALPEPTYSDLGATLPTEPTPLVENGIGGEGVAAATTTEMEGAESTATATAAVGVTPEEAAGALTVAPTATLTPSVPQWNRAASQAVVEETEEKANQRLQLIVALLNEGDPPVVQVCTPAMRALGVDTKVRMIEMGAMRNVVELLGGAAAASLVELVGKACSSAAGHGAGEYAAALRSLACNDPQVAQMAMGCVQRLTHLLQRGTAKGKEEAAAALWNVSTVNEQIKTAIVEAGALPSLVEMVGRGTPMGRESAAGCLWSMSVVNVAIKEAVTMQGAVAPLCELLMQGTATAKEEACGALWSLAMQEQVTPAMIANGAAAAATQLLFHGTDMGKESACGLLGLCAVIDANKRAVLEARAVEPMVALLAGGSSEGARAQAHLALKYLCTYRSAVPRAVERGLTEVDDLVMRLLPTSGGKMVSLIEDGMGESFGGQGMVPRGSGDAAAESHALSAVLEQLIYDLFDMATAAAVAAAREVGEAIPDGVDKPIARDRSARPLVDLLLHGNPAVKQAAAGGLMCMAVNTKMAVIEGGALTEMVELLGSGAAKAIVQLLAGAGRHPDGLRVTDYVEALCHLAVHDSRVTAVAVGGVPGLVDLLQTGNGAGKEQAAGGLYYLRRINPNIEALLQQSQVIEQLVEVLGMGTAAGRETPAMLHTLWRLLTLPEGAREVISEASAANLVQLLYTGTDVGKEAAARVMRMMGREETNRASLMRARAVEPLVELLQNAHDALRDEAAGALLACSNQSSSPAPPVAVQEPMPALTAAGGTSSWFGSIFGGGGGAVAPRGATPVPEAQRSGAVSGAYGDNEAVMSAEAEVKELVTILRQVDIAHMQTPVMSQSGGMQRQRKAAARLEQLMYYLFHAKTAYIVM